MHLACRSSQHRGSPKRRDRSNFQFLSYLIKFSNRFPMRLLPVAWRWASRHRSQIKSDLSLAAPFPLLLSETGRVQTPSQKATTYVCLMTPRSEVGAKQLPATPVMRPRHEGISHVRQNHEQDDHSDRRPTQKRATSSTSPPSRLTLPVVNPCM